MYKKGDKVIHLFDGRQGVVGQDQHPEDTVLAIDWADGKFSLVPPNNIQPFNPDSFSPCAIGVADSTNPDHYKTGGMEVIDILKAKLSPEQFKGFLIGNSLKHLFRFEKKNGQEDIDKALWHVTMLAGKDPRIK